MWSPVAGCEYCYGWGAPGAARGQLCVTDFVNIWTAGFSRAELAHALLNCNQHLEMGSDDLLIKAMHILETPECITESSFKTTSSDELTVKFTSRLYGYPLHIELQLRMGSPQFFFQKVTHPLLKTVLDLKTSERQLCAVLSDKDREISEYKEEGGQLFLKYLKTPIFNHKLHLETHTMYTTVFGQDTGILDKVLESSKKETDKTPKNNHHETDSKVIKLENVKEEKNESMQNCSEMGTSKVKEESKIEYSSQQRNPRKRPKIKLLNL